MNYARMGEDEGNIRELDACMNNFVLAEEFDVGDVLETDNVIGCARGVESTAHYVPVENVTALFNVPHRMSLAHLVRI